MLLRGAQGRNNRHGSEPGLEAGGRPETPQEETPTTPKTGDDRNPLIWLLLLGIGECMAGTALMVEKEQKVIEKIVS